MNRREFLKIAGVTTAVSGVALASSPKPSFALELGQQHDEYPYEVTKDYKGFSQSNTMFMRIFSDNENFNDEYIDNTFDHYTPRETGVSFIATSFGFNTAKGHDPEREGFRAVDMALNAGAVAVDKNFGGMSKYGIRNALLQTHPVNPKTGEKMKEQPVMVPGLFSWDNSKVDKKLKSGEGPHRFKDTKDAQLHVKKAAKFLGADLVGIAPYNERTKRWTYSEWSSMNVKPFDLPDGSKEYNPFNLQAFKNGKNEVYGITSVKSDFMREAGFEPKSIIVLAFEQDYDAFKTAPSHISSATVSKEYSRMAEASYKLAEFLRHLGYNAAPCGNDTAISVPLAIEAGLGEGSRMGMLVTEKFGPRVRLAKVYTDLEIESDKPSTFGVKAFCDVCMKCADACPGKAISKEKCKVLVAGEEMDTGVVGKSNITGVEKWFVNGTRCFSYWNYIGFGCGTCISVCPYNKIDEWHHDLAKLMTLTPFKPLLRDLDELFGYGGPVEPEERLESKYLKDAVYDFWANI